MNCSEARKVTYLAEYPEAVSPEVIEAKRHLKGCPECKRFFEQERAFSRLLRQNIVREPVPSELRKELLRHVSKRKTFPKMVYKILSIAAVLMLLTAGYIYKLHSDIKSFVMDIINDHINFLPYSGIQISSQDPLTLQKWFTGKVEFSVVLPELKAEIKGARLCFLRGKRLGLVFYEHKGSPISLFITSGLNPERLWSKEVIIHGKRMKIVEKNGFSLLLWQEKGITYALVSGLDAEELKKII